MDDESWLRDVIDEMSKDAIIDILAIEIDIFYVVFHRKNSN